MHFTCAGTQTTATQSPIKSNMISIWISFVPKLHSASNGSFKVSSFCTCKIHFSKWKYSLGLSLVGEVGLMKNIICEPCSNSSWANLVWLNTNVFRQVITPPFFIGLVRNYSQLLVSCNLVKLVACCLEMSQASLYYCLVQYHEEFRMMPQRPTCSRDNVNLCLILPWGQVGRISERKNKKCQINYIWREKSIKVTFPQLMTVFKDLLFIIIASFTVLQLSGTWSTDDESPWQH